jgi:hypothetical protein
MQVAEDCTKRIGELQQVLTSCSVFEVFEVFL